MPVALDGVFFAFLLFVVTAIWRFPGRTSRQVAEWPFRYACALILLAFLSLVFLFAYEWCMGRV